MSLNTKLSRLAEMDLCREYNFLNAPHHMADQYPHAPEAVDNTLKVAERTRVDWDFDRVVFPRFEKMGTGEAFRHGCTGRH